MPDLRCDNKLHGQLLEEEGVLEIKCRSSFCGAGRGIVVLHRFDITSGKMIETRRYRDPGGGINGASYNAPTIRAQGCEVPEAH